MSEVSDRTSVWQELAGREAAVTAVVWVALAVGMLIYIKVPLGGSGRFLNLSLYDVVVPVCLAVVWRMGNISLSEGAWKLVAGVVLLICAHAAWVWISVPDVLIAGLLRESMKNATFVVYLQLLFLVFKALPNPAPSRVVLAATLVVIEVVAVCYRLLELWVEKNMYETIFASIVLGFYLLPGLLDHRRGALSFPVRVFLFTTTVSVMVFLVSKAFLILTLLIGGGLFLQERAGPIRIPATARAWRLRVAALVASGGVVILASYLFVTGAYVVSDYQTFGESIQHSVGVRTELWSLAARAARESFPVGIGAGQFGTLTRQDPNLADYPGLLFVHNTPLALVTEYGVLGVGFLLSLGWLAASAMRGFPPRRRWMSLVYFLVPAMLNDVLGLRMFQVLLAYGLVRANLGVEGQHQALKHDRSDTR